MEVSVTGVEISVRGVEVSVRGVDRGYRGSHRFEDRLSLRSVSAMHIININ